MTEIPEDTRSAYMRDIKEVAAEIDELLNSDALDAHSKFLAFCGMEDDDVD